MATFSASAIRRTILLLEEFRKISPEMPMQIALILMLIAEKPRITFAEITRRTGLGKSSVNRNVALLSTKSGSGLVDYGKDPLDNRNNIAWLTPAGERFIRSITHYIGESTKETA